MQIEDLLPRDVWVWVPPSYFDDPSAHFPVIYMHDGQNLFYPEKSYSHVTWGIAETITKLSGWGYIQPAIVVGIDNTPNRFGDYLPTRPFDTPEGKAYLASLPEEAQPEHNIINFVADQYLKLVAEVIKPRVDQELRTLPDLKHTFMMGSSMGGLISLYGVVLYPEVFGGAGCFSTDWPSVNQVINAYLEAHLPEAGTHKFYFDHGSEELDAEYAPSQSVVNEIGKKKGYKYGKDWLTRFGAGTGHHERAWRSRLHIALRFFLGSWNKTT